MFWSYMSIYSAASFKRATGIHKNVFLEIIEILNNHKQLHRKHPTSGNKPILSTEDALLMVLMYYREYRTQYHIGITYGLSESRVCEMIKEIESIIVQDARYHLPGKKKLLQSENTFEVVLIDVSESPVERPKKNNADIIQARKSDTLKKHK
jgi:Helix-turn-helix of DDE superfamily endonuclease